MYQSLIYRVLGRQGAGNQSRSLAPALDSQLVECAADPLVNGVRADTQPGGDFLAVVMEIDQQQDLDLPTKTDNAAVPQQVKSANLNKAPAPQQVVPSQSQVLPQPQASPPIRTQELPEQQGQRK